MYVCTMLSGPEIREVHMQGEVSPEIPLVSDVVLCSFFFHVYEDRYHHHRRLTFV